MNDRTYSYISKTPFLQEGNAKVFSFSLPFLRRMKISFGVLRRHIGTDSKSILFFLKLSGKRPEKTGDEAKKRMFGLQVIRYDDRIRLGFIRRTQTIKKAG